MKNHKNTHMYNAIQFALCAPSKLVFRGGGERPGGPKETPKQLAAKVEQVRKQAVQLVKGVRDANYKEFRKMDESAADSILNRLLNDVFKNGNPKKLSALLMLAFSATTGTLNQKAADALGRIRTMTAKAKKEIKEDLKSLKERRNKVLDKIFGKEKDYDKRGREYTQSIIRDTLTTGELLPEDVEAQITEYGKEIWIKEAKATRKSLFYDEDAYMTHVDGKMSLRRNYDTAVKSEKRIQDAINSFIKREQVRQIALKGKKDNLETHYVAGGSYAERKEARAATEKWVEEKIIPLMKKGETVFVRLTGYTSVEGSKAVNDALSKRRAEAQKQAVLRVLRAKFGPNWRKTKGNVDFYITHKQLEPELKKTNLPKALQDAFASDKEYEGIRKLLGVTNIDQAIAKINKNYKGEGRLLMIIRVLAKGIMKPRSVLSEYNKYFNIKARQGDAKAEEWLTKNSKYLVKMPHVLRFLLANVGKSRSSEVAVAKENPWTVAAQESLYNLDDLGPYQFASGGTEYDTTTATSKTKKSFTLKASYQPDVSVNIDPKTSRISMKFEDGRTLTLSAKSPNLLALAKRTITNEVKRMSRKVEKGYRNVRSKLVASGKFYIDYEYEATPHNVWTKKLLVFDKTGKVKKGSVENTDYKGGKFTFNFPPPKEEEKVAVAAVTRRKINEMFA